MQRRTSATKRTTLISVVKRSILSQYDKCTALNEINNMLNEYETW